MKVNILEYDCLSEAEAEEHVTKRAALIKSDKVSQVSLKVGLGRSTPLSAQSKSGLQEVFLLANI